LAQVKKRQILFKFAQFFGGIGRKALDESDNRGDK
jgi:hypothetical protein